MSLRQETKGWIGAWAHSHPHSRGPGGGDAAPQKRPGRIENKDFKELKEFKEFKED